MRPTNRCEPTWHGLSDLRPYVVAFLGRFLRDDAEIEDTAQETLLRAARFRVGLVDAARLRPWILRIALNVLRDRRRREMRLPRVDAADELLEGIEGREAVPGDTREEAWIDLSGVVVDRATAFHHLERALAGLAREDQDALARWCSGGDAGAGAVFDAPRVRKHHVFRARRRLTRAVIQRFARDPDLGWPSVDGLLVEPRPAGGARGARARTGGWNGAGARSPGGSR